MLDRGEPFRQLIDISDFLISKRVGIVPYFSEQPREAGSPEFFHFAAQACRTEAFAQQKNFRSAGGASADRRVAMARSIGEAVERYCSAIYEVNELPVTSYAAAPFKCVAPEEFALYSEAQYNDETFLFAPFEETTPVAWFPALDLMTKEIVHVPAGMVFVPYIYYRDTGETPIVQPVSTGLACHGSYHQAAISGICEVIERDAFAIMWQAMISPLQIRLDTLTARNADLVERFLRVGYQVTLFNITTDVGVPTVLAFQRNQTPGNVPVAFAVASALDPEDAVSNALDELAHTLRYMQHVLKEQPRLEPDPSFRSIVDQETHLNFWCDANNAHGTDFLFERAETCAFEDIENDSTGSVNRDLETLIHKVAAIGHHILVADVTTPDVEELGLCVVRGLIPGFHPLLWNHKYRALGGVRLWSVPQARGHRGVTKETGDNPLPHPFP
jgi:ribosomal protein S12 methylthiotransferase accessory factor